MITKYECLNVNFYDDIYIIKESASKLIRQYKKRDIIKYTEINEAYDVLKNEKTRLNYDKELYDEYINPYSKLKVKDIVSVAYLYYRCNEEEQALKLLNNIKFEDKNHFEAVILISKIYKQIVTYTIEDKNTYKRKNHYEDAEDVLIKEYERYKNSSQINKARLLIELIELYYLMNNTEKVEIYTDFINNITLSKESEVKYLKNRQKELEKKYKNISLDIKEEVEVGISKPINKFEEIYDLLKEFINYIEDEINNGFTEKIKINRKLDRFKDQSIYEIENLLDKKSKSEIKKGLETILTNIEKITREVDEKVQVLEKIRIQALNIIEGS